MNPFDQLLRFADGRRPRQPSRASSTRIAPPAFEHADTKTATLLNFLREAGPASTATLGGLLGLESRLVWGLLRSRRDRGQCHFADGLWSIVPEFDEQQHADLSAAAALLRRHGWTVRPPRSQACALTS